MTRDDIIRMARDAGSIDSEDVIETVYAAFAAAEREALASEAEKNGNTILAMQIRARGQQ